MGRQTVLHRTETVEDLADGALLALGPARKEGVVDAEHQHHHHHQRSDRDRQVLEIHVHEEEDQETDHTDQQGGGEAVGEDQQADGADGQDDLQGELLEVVEIVAPAFEGLGQVEDRADLGEFKHLDGMAGNPDTADGAVDFHPDARNVQHDEHQHRQPVEPERSGAVEAQGDEVAEDQGDEAHQDRFGLLHEDGDLAHPAGRGQETAGGKYGHDRDHREQHDENPDHLVSLEFPESLHHTTACGPPP